MNAPQSISPRQRLQQLLEIPDHQRTDAQWDEINDLEIKLASGNREHTSGRGVQRSAPLTSGHRKSSVTTQGKKLFRKFTRRPRRATAS
jgi:hypothetical protein